MKRYKFIGDPQEYNDGKGYIIGKGRILKGDTIPKGWDFSVQYTAEKYPKDWELVKSEIIEEPKVNKDNTKPDHYKGSTIQPIDLIESMDLRFREGNIVKYVSRYKNKNGLEDLLKAKVYLERLIKELQNEDKSN